jgi:DNA-binding transcriptional regulator YiaG
MNNLKPEKVNLGTLRKAVASVQSPKTAHFERNNVIPLAHASASSETRTEERKRRQKLEKELEKLKAPKGRPKREEYPVTRAAVAEKLGVSPATVKAWENGISPPREGYSKDLRRDPVRFAEFAERVHQERKRAQSWLDAAPSVSLGNRRGMGVKKGPW